MKKLLSNLKRLLRIIALLIGINLLTSCKTAPRVVPVNNYCLLTNPIKASDDDKKALKLSTISKEFIEQIVNHNDIWILTCKGD